MDIRSPNFSEKPDMANKESSTPAIEKIKKALSLGKKKNKDGKSINLTSLIN